MRKVVIWLFSSLFSIIAPLTILAITFYSLFSTPELLKESLGQSNIYPETVKFVVNQIGEAVKGTPPLAPLKGAVADELTPTYLQSKIEIFLDQLYAYASQDSETPPSLKFKDLKDKIAKKFPLFKRLPAESTQIFDQEYKLDANQLKTARETHKYTWLFSLWGSVASIALLVLILAWSSSFRSGIRTCGRLLLKAGLPSLITTLIGLFIILKTPLPSLHLPPPMEFLEKSTTAWVLFISQKLLIQLALAYATVSAAGVLAYVSSLGGNEDAGLTPS